MKNFNFYVPTEVVFGKDSELKIGELIQGQQCKKILVHYGSNSAKKTGLLDRVFKILQENNIAFVELGGVVPNPVLSKVYEGIKLCKEENVDFILAVGGGSVIDSAKAIGYGMVNDCDVWDLFLKKQQPTGCLPIGTILTIAAAGSETSGGSVITKEEEQLKRDCNSNYSRCKFAIMNPELTYTLPEYHTQSGCVDIMMHTMERYFTFEKDTLEVTDAIAESILKVVMKNAKILLDTPHNYKARAEIMWAGSLAHNDLTGCGNGGGDWASHMIEHELGGMFNVIHGAGLAAVWGSWARYVYKENIDRFVQFAKNVCGVDKNELSQEEIALAGIEKIEEFFTQIHMPISISQLGVDLNVEQIEELALKCTNYHTNTVGGFKRLGFEDIKNIYTMAAK